MELLLAYTTADSTGSSSIPPQSQGSNCMWWAAAPQCLVLLVDTALGAALLTFPLEPAMVTHLQDAWGGAAAHGSLDGDYITP